MYELTPLLTTVASCSMTVIAIIGGFIARKLISMSSERHEITAKLNEIDEKIEFKREQVAFLMKTYSPDSQGEKNLTPEERFRAHRDKREELQAEIKWMSIQRSYTEKRLEHLKNPHGMKMSLLVFVSFSFFGVILPFCLIPFRTENYTLFLVTKAGIIFLFVLCLSFVYYYLLYLLRWKNREVVSRWREYFQFPKNKSIDELSNGIYEAPYKKDGTEDNLTIRK